MLGADAIRRREIGDRARHLQHPVVAAGAEPEPLDRPPQQRASAAIGPAESRNGSAAEIGIRAGSSTVVARLLRETRRADALTYDGRRFARLSVGDGQDRHGRHVHDQIDAVAERSGEPAAVLGDLRRRAPASAALVAEKAARASPRCLFALSDSKDSGNQPDILAFSIA